MRRALSLALVPMVGLFAFPAAAPLVVAANYSPKMDAAVIVGVVRSQASAGISSATVFVEGKNLGTLTKDDGTYRFEVPEPRIPKDSVSVTARLVGFKQQTKRLLLRAGRTDTLNFELQSNPIKLGEVVVSGEAGKTSESISETVADATTAGTIAMAQKGAWANGPAASPAPYGLNESSTEVQEADEVLVYARQEAKDPGRYQGSPSASANFKARGIRPLGAKTPNGQSTVAPRQQPLPAATEGTLIARRPDGEIAGQFPLKHTQVDADISGFLARTVVTQQYTNPYKDVIEGVYVFPLPSMAAVNDFVMEIGGRKIVGLVRPRDEAERIYNEARARGQTASLLTQERPNIFTQSVANIEPGGSVDIHITYFERLKADHGEYEWVFPMVVGPRYIPGSQQGTPHLASDEHHPVVNTPDGGGWSHNTDIVPDASHITPPVLKPGQRSGHDIGLTVTLDAGMPVTKLNAVAHHVEITRPSDSKRVITLAHGDSIPNRDFVLRWSVAGDETQFGVITHREGKDGFLTLAMQPPAEPRDEQVTPREITFIMDVSGSMMGTPIEMSRTLVLRALDRLRPDDLFNIVYFSGGNAQLWPEARLGTENNIAEAKNFLHNLSAGGGTEMLAGLERALHAHHDARYLQMYIFLTDGFVGDEPRILSTIKAERGDARFFGFGIGSSVNRYLIDGIGEVGGGESFAMIPRDSVYAERGVRLLFDAIDSPVLVDVAVDWNGLPVQDVYPSKLRDLFAGQTIDLIARYSSPAKGTAYVTGRIGNRRVRYPIRVELPEREPEHAALAPMWARTKIADLSTQMLGADSADQRGFVQQITDLAVNYRLASQYTSFVAVDESRIVGDGHPRKIMQPVELPEGVSYAGIFGEQCVGEPMRIGAWGIDIQGTESGRVRIGNVRPDGAAYSAGVTKGATVTKVNGVAVTNVNQVEQVLMQSGGKVTVGLDNGKSVVLVAP